MSSNCSGVVSRPWALTVSWNEAAPGGSGGPPTVPAATCTFCSFTAAITSPVVIPRLYICGGFSHSRIE